LVESPQQAYSTHIRLIASISADALTDIGSDKGNGVKLRFHRSFDSLQRALVIAL
jgi:hypothetical protein